MEEFFRTSYGDKIALMPGVEEIIYPRSSDEARYTDLLENSFVSERFRRKKVANKVQIKKISSDLNSYTLVIDFLEELRLLSREYDTALDIAGGAGIHAALLRGRYAKQVDVADVQDGSDPDLTKRLTTALRKFRLDKLKERWLNSPTRRLKVHKHLNVPSIKNYYNFNFKRTPTVDNFIIGDWRETVTKRYDFIMNFMCFWLWDHKKTIPKIASLLNPGGVFVTLAPYCWDGRGLGGDGSVLGGAFPFFDQRLNLDDTKRYYEQFKPNLAKYVDEIYNCFDPFRPTIKEYVECALESGMVVRGTKRIYNNEQKFALTYKKFFGDKIIVNPDCKTGITVDAGEVLVNISRFRNDVIFEDLLTRGVILIFQKP